MDVYILKIIASFVSDPKTFLNFLLLDKKISKEVSSLIPQKQKEFLIPVIEKSPNSKYKWEKNFHRYPNGQLHGKFVMNLTFEKMILRFSRGTEHGSICYDIVKNYDNGVLNGYYCDYFNEDKISFDSGKTRLTPFFKEEGRYVKGKKVGLFFFEDIHLGRRNYFFHYGDKVISLTDNVLSMTLIIPEEGIANKVFHNEKIGINFLDDLIEFLYNHGFNNRALAMIYKSKDHLSAQEFQLKSDMGKPIVNILKKYS